jgi:hypothetical protein
VRDSENTAVCTDRVNTLADTSTLIHIQRSFRGFSNPPLDRTKLILELEGALLQIEVCIDAQIGVVFVSH